MSRYDFLIRADSKCSTQVNQFNVQLDKAFMVKQHH